MDNKKIIKDIYFIAKLYGYAEEMDFVFSTIYEDEIDRRRKECNEDSHFAGGKSFEILDQLHKQDFVIVWPLKLQIDLCGIDNIEKYIDRNCPMIISKKLVKQIEPFIRYKDKK